MDSLSATLAALADPTRRALLARLSQGETNLTELAKPFDMTIPAVAKHLKVLEDAGLIKRGVRSKSRPARFEPQALRQVADWLEQYRVFWGDPVDRLDVFLARL